MKDLLRAIKLVFGNKWLTIANFLTQTIVTLISLVPALFYRKIFDLVEEAIKTGVKPGMSDKFILYSVYFLILAVTTIIANRMSMYFWVKWSNYTERLLTIRSFDHMQSLSMDYFATNSTGKIVEVVSRGIGDTMNAASAILFDYFPQLVTLVVTTIILFTVDYRFGLIIALGIPLYIGITLIFNKRIIKIHDDIRTNYEKLGAVRTESIINVKTVKSYARENYQSAKYSKIINEKVKNNMRWVRIANVMQALRGVLYQGSVYLALVLGVYMVMVGNITLGSFVLVWTYVNKAYEPMWWLMRMYDELIKQLRAVKRLFAFIDTKPTVADKENAKNLKVKQGEIQLKNVKFAYPDNDEKVIIKGINLNIPAKSTVAIVGKSGSGKTTLAKLLLRFHDIDSGKILIDKQDISEITQASLRKNISYVLQDSILFNDTANNNIRFGKTTANRRKIIEAAKLANAHEFIMNLPKKYNTIVGERGVKLSGGEQQRVNIARAILKNAPILILDEATSSLDSESEIAIQSALEHLMKDKTTIIIAHRLSTVMKADLIVVMDKGKIMETGTHKDLIKQKGGIYKKLYEIQSGGYLK